MFCLQKRSLNERELPNKGIKLQHKNGLLHPIDHLIISHFVTLSNSTPSFNTSLIINEKSVHKYDQGAAGIQCLCTATGTT